MTQHEKKIKYNKIIPICCSIEKNDIVQQKKNRQHYPYLAHPTPPPHSLLRLHLPPPPPPPPDD